MVSGQARLTQVDMALAHWLAVYVLEPAPLQTEQKMALTEIRQNLSTCSRHHPHVAPMANAADDFLRYIDGAPVQGLDLVRRGRFELAGALSDFFRHAAIKPETYIGAAQ